MSVDIAYTPAETIPTTEGMSILLSLLVTLPPAPPTQLCCKTP